MVACSPFGPAGEFAASRHGAVTRSQAAENRLSSKVVRRLLRDRVLDEPVPGVLVVVGSPSTWQQQLYVATLASKRSGVGGTRAAAGLHVMDGYPAGPIELIMPGHRHIDLPDLIVRRAAVPEEDRVEVTDIACTGIARTLCDLGSIDPPEQVRIAFEWAWRAGHSLTWMEETATRLNDDRRRGPRLLLSLIAEARRRDRPTESALEVNVEDVIGSFPGLVRQHVICTHNGDFVARVDFAIPDLKIAIEAHSRKHHFGVAATASDGEREFALQAEGWIVRFVTDAHRRNPDGLRTSLAALVAARTRLFDRAA